MLLFITDINSRSFITEPKINVKNLTLYSQVQSDCGTGPVLIEMDFDH